MSRTPVRAALKRLVGDGLATADVGQGVRVAEWSEADIEETFRIRLLLEPHATELAVHKGGEDLVKRLDALNGIMALAIEHGDDGAVARIQAANRDFHSVLLASAGSPRLRSILETMIDMPIIMRSFFLYTRAELSQSLHHHYDITHAVQVRDGELGKRAMQLHLKMSQARVAHHRRSWQEALVGNREP